jgi:hypothetical protein
MLLDLGVTVISWLTLNSTFSTVYNPNSLYMRVLFGYIPFGIKAIGWFIHTIVIGSLLKKVPIFGWVLSAISYVAIVDPQYMII